MPGGGYAIQNYGQFMALRLRAWVLKSPYNTKRKQIKQWRHSSLLFAHAGFQGRDQIIWPATSRAWKHSA
jgi:hypothetical protein